jgi:hypothetical protein
LRVDNNIVCYTVFLALRCMEISIGRILHHRSLIAVSLSVSHPPACLIPTVGYSNTKRAEQCSLQTTLSTPLCCHGDVRCAVRPPRKVTRIVLENVWLA